MVVGATLIGFGAFRLARKDSQARGFLIVGGGGMAIFALWEILTVQGRVIDQVVGLFEGAQAEQARQTIERMVDTGQADITVNAGLFLILAGGVLAMGAVALCLVNPRKGRSVVPQVVAAPPPPPGAVIPGGGIPSDAPIHPPGERCATCNAILGETTNVCWHCGRLWFPVS